MGITSQSASSIALLKILCRECWSIEPIFRVVSSIEEGKDLPAFLIIGDMCLNSQEIPGYDSIDLAQAWTYATGLPFVFGIFAARLDAMKSRGDAISDFCSTLRRSYVWGLEHPEAILELAQKKSSLPIKQLEEYFSLLKYETTPEMIRGLELFKDKQLSQRINGATNHE